MNLYDRFKHINTMSKLFLYLVASIISLSSCNHIPYKDNASKDNAIQREIVKADSILTQFEPIMPPTLM